MTHQLLFPNFHHRDRVRSPFRYPGGKFYAIKFLEPFWMELEHDEFREPFLGGGQVFFAKPGVKYVWLNDIADELIHTYKIIQKPETRGKLLEILAKEYVDKQRYGKVRSWNPQNAIDRAHRFYYLNRTSYSGIMHNPNWGYHQLNSAPPSSWVKFIEAAGKKLEGVKLTCLDFADVIEAPAKGNQVFMYLDPPYIEADQKRAYKHSFTLAEHKRLASILRHTKHKFLLSYDDCPTARDLYSWANLIQEKWWYCTANKKATCRKKGLELLITNFQISKHSADAIPMSQTQEVTCGLPT